MGYRVCLPVYCPYDRAFTHMLGVGPGLHQQWVGFIVRVVCGWWWGSRSGKRSMSAEAVGQTMRIKLILYWADISNCFMWLVIAGDTSTSMGRHIMNGELHGWMSDSYRLYSKVDAFIFADCLMGKNERNFIKIWLLWEFEQIFIKWLHTVLFIYC